MAPAGSHELKKYEDASPEAQAKLVDDIFAALASQRKFSIDDAAEELGYEETYALCEACDNVFFYCASCGWYLEIAMLGEDKDDELNCSNCNEG